MHIEIRDIHKSYGSTHANRGISFRVDSGKIHGILGENGAGKSTLMKILAGYISKSSGEIRVSGRPASYDSPAGAMALGIGMLYQDPLDFPPLTVLENFMLGLTRSFFPPRRAQARKLRELCETLSFTLDPDASVESLTPGERQQLELLRYLARGIEVLILDEPTTGISTLQKDTLFDALRKLARDGKSVLLVSHKLEDVEALCDRVTVLRQGEVAGELEQPFSSRQMLDLMFGAPPPVPVRCTAALGEDVLSFENVSGKGGRVGLRRCSVTFSRGEVVGLAGLEGSGQGVFLRLAAGLQSPTEGRIVLAGIELTGKNHQSFRNAGVTFLPTARLEEGLLPGLTVAEHFALNTSEKPFVIPWNGVMRQSRERIDRFRIKGAPQSPVETLSGGNQQRLLLSLVPSAPTLLLLEQPTRGLDLESAHWFWEQLQKLCESGTTIVFSSAELDEILMVSQRVLVFYDGSVVLNVKTEDTDFNQLGKAIAGKV